MEILVDIQLTVRKTAPIFSLLRHNNTSLDTSPGPSYTHPLHMRRTVGKKNTKMTNGVDAVN